MHWGKIPSNAKRMGVYVHFPWCLEKCPYCDFLSVKVSGANGNVDRARQLIPHQTYADAVIRELDFRSPALGTPATAGASERFLVESVFFGGGTPSLWNPEELGRVLAAVRSTLPTAEDLEVTVECNPTSVSERHFSKLLEAGVNRVSIGVQAIDGARLNFLGRWHDSAGGLAALRAARAAGVPRVSGDLIFGVHQQGPQDAARDVAAVIATGIEHLSAYALTIEPGTRFGALDRQGRLPLLEDDLVAQSFEKVSRTLTTAGFNHYEVSNYAKPGQESRHNMGYWLGQDYLGLGTGAYGTVTANLRRVRYRNLLVPERYIEAFAEPSRATETPFSTHVSDHEELPGETSIREALMLGLRTARGICPDQIGRRFGAPFWTPERLASKERLIAAGRLEETRGFLSIPPKDWLFADGIIRELM